MIRRPLWLLAALLAGLASLLLAHDLFLKLDSYFLEPDAEVTVPLINGTFGLSENAIDRVRFADISRSDLSGRVRFDTTVVSARNDSTFLALRTGPAGTQVFGVSLYPGLVEMSGAEFHEYLREEGLRRVIADRQRDGIADEPVTERYAKHVKAVVQAGDLRSDGFGAVLGYPAELVPLDNPYESRRGGAIRFRALVNGVPAAGITVLSGGRTPAGGRLPRREQVTDADGVVTVRANARGRWYVQFISIKPVVAPDRNYDSEWATITFEVR